MNVGQGAESTPKDIGKLRDEVKAKESLKDMEKKKQGKVSHVPREFPGFQLNGRAEKIEEAKARARVKAQIEADKRERAEKAAREKALREGATLPQEPATPAAAAPPKPVVAGKDFPETRLQIRMASGGQPYVTTLSSDASEYTFLSPTPALLETYDGVFKALREVAEYLAGQTLDVDVEAVDFAMNFPRFVRSCQALWRPGADDAL